MSTNLDLIGTNLVPALRYRDIAAAIDWLCAAFGFEQHRVVTAVDGSVLHAQLTFGNDMIMLLPARGSDLDRHPEEFGGADMQSCYFVVEDADLHHRNAKAAGADILDMTKYDYGGRGYSCRDPEGHIWNFGTYNPRQRKATSDPWKRKAMPQGRSTASLAVGLRFAARLGDKLTPPVVVAATVAAVIAAASVGWTLVVLRDPGAGGERLANVAHRLADEAIERVAVPTREPAKVRSLAFGVNTGMHQGGVEAIERAPEQIAQEEDRTAPKKISLLHSYGERDQAQNVKDVTEHAAQEALRQRRAAQDSLRTLHHERSAKEAADHAALEARKLQAKAGQDARERERVAKDSIERSGKATQNRLAEVSHPKTSEIEPRQEVRQTRERIDDQVWDCLPSPKTGQIVCRPQETRTSSGSVIGSAAPKTSAIESATKPSARQNREANADGQFWECLPRPPAGKIVCSRISGQGER